MRSKIIIAERFCVRSETRSDALRTRLMEQLPPFQVPVKRLKAKVSSSSAVSLVHSHPVSSQPPVVVGFFGAGQPPHGKKCFFWEVATSAPPSCSTFFFFFSAHFQLLVGRRTATMDTLSSQVNTIIRIPLFIFYERKCCTGRG